MSAVSLLKGLDVVDAQMDDGSPSKAQVMTGRIYISEREHVLLIRATHGRRAPIATAFGGNKVWLSRDAEGRIVSQWAMALLAQWRGLSVEDGAGI